MDNSNQLQKSFRTVQIIGYTMMANIFYMRSSYLSCRQGSVRGNLLIIFCLFLAVFQLSCTRYYEEKSAVAVVERVLDDWAKEQYSSAQKYWVNQDQYKPLEHIEKFYNEDILDYKEKLSVVVQIYIDFKPEAIYPSGGIWTFTVIKIDGHWKIKDYGALSL